MPSFLGMHVFSLDSNIYILNNNLRVYHYEGSDPSDSPCSRDNMAFMVRSYDSNTCCSSRLRNDWRNRKMRDTRYDVHHQD